MPAEVTMPDQDVRHCAGVKANGAPCGCEPSLLIVDDETPDTWWCFNHHPAYEEARDAARSKGGFRKAAKFQRFRFLDKAELIELRTPADAQRQAAAVFAAVATGRLSSAAGSVALRALDAFTKACEQTELLTRLDELERQVARTVNITKGGAR